MTPHRGENQTPSKGKVSGVKKGVRDRRDEAKVWRSQLVLLHIEDEVMKKGKLHAKCDPYGGDLPRRRGKNDRGLGERGEVIYKRSCRSLGQGVESLQDACSPLK